MKLIFNFITLLLSFSSNNSFALDSPKWKVWDKTYEKQKVIEIVYVNEDTLKKIGLFGNKFSIEFAQERYLKPFFYPAKDKNFKIRDIYLITFKAEYDCKNRTEKTISMKFFTSYLNDPNKEELFNYDFPLGKVTNFKDAPTWFGLGLIDKACYQLFP